MTEAIAAGFADRGSLSPVSIPVRTTDSGPTPDETPPGNEVCDFASFFSGGDDASNLSAQVPSYSSELGYNVPNNIKVQISNGQYVNLAKLAHNFSDPDDETQYFSVRDGGLTMSKKIQGQTYHRYTHLDRPFPCVRINICYCTPRMCNCFI